MGGQETFYLALAGAVAATVAAAFGGGWAAVKYLLTKIERDVTAERAARESAISKLHERLGDVRDKYVRRDDLNGHISRIERSLADHMKASVKQWGQVSTSVGKVHERLDRFVERQLAQGGKDK